MVWKMHGESGDNLDALIDSIHGLCKSFRHCSTLEAPSKAERLRYWWNYATAGSKHSSLAVARELYSGGA